MKKVIALLLIIILVYGVYVYGTELRYIGQENLLFSVSETIAEDITDLNNNTPNSSGTKLTGILPQKWEDNTTLIVKTVSVFRCGSTEIWGSYRVEGNNLILSTGERKFGFQLVRRVSACVYQNTLTYKISNLERKDYKITFINEH